MKFLKRCMSALLATSLALPLVVQAADWAHEKKLSFDTTSEGVQIDTDVSSLPVLVRLHSGNFNFGEARKDGADLRFFAADGKTALSHYIERYDVANELAVVWVKLPKLKAKSKADAILVRWGNENAKGADDSKAVYDESQLLVLNFSDGVKDATGNGNHASQSNAKPVEAGPIGGSVAFNGSERIVIPASASLVLKPGGGWTFSTWIKPEGLDKGNLLSLDGVSIEFESGVPFLRAGSAKALASAKLQPGIWQHLAVVYSGGKAQFFIDGDAKGDAALNMSDAAGEVVIGQGFRGELDAVILAAGSRTPAYIKAVASSQMADSLMLGFDEGGAEAAEVAYFSILLGAVTLDGWIVIGLLGIMAIVSLWVMYSKTVMLSSYEKANAAFLEYFKQHSFKLLQPDSPEVAEIKNMASVQKSPLFKLYEVGLSEINQRFEAQQRSGQNLNITTAALESIRAALDAVIVRTGQKLNSGIVLLTIAISGGPFLGLLGTVVGVMITFAAIAAAGDVNVNAIAPGIAAALVATVAGLAVAIPALFAYNWFAIKIKNITADIQVFADEFLTRSGELHNE